MAERTAPADPAGAAAPRRGRRALAAAATAGGALSLAALLLGQAVGEPPSHRTASTRAVIVTADGARTPDTTTGLDL